MPRACCRGLWRSRTGLECRCPTARSVRSCVRSPTVPCPPLNKRSRIRTGSPSSATDPNPACRQVTIYRPNNYALSIINTPLITEYRSRYRNFGIVILRLHEEQCSLANSRQLKPKVVCPCPPNSLSPSPFRPISPNWHADNHRMNRAKTKYGQDGKEVNARL